jgi:predicted amino acid-binding ACT domain protein/glycine cleavage system regulatory protein
MFGIQGFLPTPFKKQLSDTFQIASADVMTVNLQADSGLGFGRTIRQKETKHQNGDMSYSYKGSASVFPDEGEKSDTAREKRIAAAMGNFSIMFDLDEFMGRSDAKKRELVFELSSPESYGWDETVVRAELTDILGHKVALDWNSKLPVAANVAQALNATHKNLTDAKAVKRSKDSAKAEIIEIRQKMMEEATDSVAEIQKKLKELRDRKSELDAEIAKAQEIKKQHQNFRYQKAALEAARKELANHKPRDLARLEEDSVGATNKLINCEVQIEEAEKKIEALHRLVDEKSQRLASARENILRIDRRQHIRETINLIDKKGCPLMGDKCQSDLSEYRKTLEAEWERIDSEVRVKRAMRDAIQLEHDGLVEERGGKMLSLKYSKKFLKEVRIEVRGKEDQLKNAQRFEAEHESELKVLRKEEEINQSARASLSAVIDVSVAEKARVGIVEQINGLEDEARKAQEVKNVMANFDKANIAALEAEEQVAELTALHEALGPKGVQAKILADVVGPLTGIVNGLLEKIPSIEDEPYSVEFQLHDLNGKEVFGIYWPREAGNVHYNTLSGGQQILFGAALMVALIMQANPPHKSMCIEAAELTAGNFYNLLKALDLIATDIDNILVASCSDKVIADNSMKEAFPVGNPFEKWNVVHLE